MAAFTLMCEKKINKLKCCHSIERWKKMMAIKLRLKKKSAALHIYAKHVMKTQSNCWFIHGSRINFYFKWTHTHTHTRFHRSQSQCAEICHYLMLHLMTAYQCYTYLCVCQLYETFKLMTMKNTLKNVQFLYEEITAECR